MEEPEARDAQHDETDQRIEHLQGILVERLGIMNNQIGRKSTTDNNEAVNQKNAPIRQ